METVNDDDLLHLRLKNNLHKRVKDLINNTLFFNQCHMLNKLLTSLMWLMWLGDTNKTSMDQVLYYVYKTYDHIEELAKNLNNTEILTPEGHHVPKIT